ncbi:galactose-1-phosphate uridylyltransferase [candidate division KSB1 bacterium]|nr:galactose-1-phosphate uridylyltransferase [candidate division KSB1 bacterium]
MSKNFVRQNKATKEWVIYASSRGNRPKDFKQKQKSLQQIQKRDEDCPFCPGNEAMLPEIISERSDSSGQNWQTRIVPNKYPALVPNGNTHRSQEGIYLTMPGYGTHEVIIEDQQHDRTIATMPLQAVETLIETYHQRYVELMSRHRNMLTIIFRNHGARAGTSLIHPHSQLIVTGFVPRHFRWREEQAQRYFDQYGSCVFCDILKFESDYQTRIIAKTSTMTAFIPYHAEVPFEIWIMPNRHQADFGAVSENEKRDLAQVLKEILRKLHIKLNNPDYNYIINTAARYKAGEPQLHWYLQIRPRLTTPAGFEIGSGISINPSIPENDAEFLKEAD